MKHASADGKFLRSLLLLSLAAQFAGAQNTSGPIVSGVVYDSIAKKPLAGAMVQIVSNSLTAKFGSSAVADAQGRYEITSVPDGRYTLGFFHPMLDSLGVEPTLRDVTITGQQPLRANLGIPSAARLRNAICGRNTGGVVVGFVRDARDGSPISGASITGEWLELSFRPGGYARNTARMSAKSAENGWFSLCNVPTGGSMRLLASRGADSTDMVQVTVSADGFLRRELFVGASRTIVTGDSTKQGDTSAVVRRRRVGDGRLAGTVVAEPGGAPLSGAVVSIVDGPQVRSNERGDWTITEAPSGTRILEVRAVGRYPQRMAVDVVTGAPPLALSLSTLKSVLDTMRVIALRSSVRDLAAFEERRRSNIGKYFTPADLEKRGLLRISDLFRSVPGVSVETNDVQERLITMRAGGLNDRCNPRVFVNGMPIHETGMDNVKIVAEDIDAAVNMGEVGGIEVYTGLAVPIEYKQGISLDPCGVILIWRK